MHRKNLNSESIFFKIFILYVFVYLLAFFLKYSNILEYLIIDIEYKYLILINMISILLGLPISIVFDIILIKFFGMSYVLLFSPILALIGLIQITYFRKNNIKISNNNFLMKNIKNNRFYNFFEKVSFKPFFIYVIRTFPILPFLVGSYLIASSLINKKIIFLYSLIGGYFYYFSLLLIIRIA